MLVAKFNCPKCNAVLKPTTPLPSGKKLTCPKCAGVIEVPKPEFEVVEEVEEEVEEVEAVEEVEPKKSSARRSAPLEDEEEEGRPSRRRAAREEDYEEDEERPRKGRGRANRGRGGKSGGKIAILVGGILLGVVGMGVGGYFLYSLVLGSSPEQVQIQCIKEATTVLAGVKDQSSAELAKPRIVALARRLRDNQEKDLTEEVTESIRNPERAQAKAAQREKDRKANQEAMQNLNAELQRVDRVPGGRDVVQSFYTAWTFGGNPFRNNFR